MTKLSRSKLEYERQTDQLVYKLYYLTLEEVKIMERNNDWI